MEELSDVHTTLMAIGRLRPGVGPLETEIVDCGCNMRVLQRI